MAVKLTIETEREEDGRWIAEVLEIPGALAYGATLEEAVREAKAQKRSRSPCSGTAPIARTSTASNSRPLEYLVFDEGAQGPCRAQAHRLEVRSAGRLTVMLVREGWPEYTWSFHEGDEIGPKMLARIAKRTGLKPNDL